LVHLMRQGVRNQHANLYGFEPVTQREFAQWVAELLGLETADVSAADITKKHGATVFEALTSNTPVMTKHTAWRESYAPVHTDLKELIQQTISQLQAAD
jgi:hypothetical protein